MAGLNKTDNCQNGYCEIPARTFTMGSPVGVGNNDEHPQRQITMPGKALRKTEVTVEEYKAFLANNVANDLRIVLSGCSSGSEKIAVRGNLRDGTAALIARAKVIAGLQGCLADNLKVDRQPLAGMPAEDDCVWMNSLGDDHPIVCLDQKEAEAFCESEDASLPSEADIENASRGMSGTDEYGTPIESAVINRTGRYDIPFTTQAVCGSKHERENSLGICDLAGNVWERTSTKYDPNFYAIMPSFDPNMTLTGAVGEQVVFRGGSFGLIREIARVALRVHGAETSHVSIGFRCVRPLPPTI